MATGRILPVGVVLLLLVVVLLVVVLLVVVLLVVAVVAVAAGQRSGFCLSPSIIIALISFLSSQSKLSSYSHFVQATGKTFICVRLTNTPWVVCVGGITVGIG